MKKILILPFIAFIFMATLSSAMDNDNADDSSSSIETGVIVPHWSRAIRDSIDANNINQLKNLLKKIYTLTLDSQEHIFYSYKVNFSLTDLQIEELKDSFYEYILNKNLLNLCSIFATYIDLELADVINLTEDNNYALTGFSVGSAEIRGKVFDLRSKSEVKVIEDSFVNLLKLEQFSENNGTWLFDDFPADIDRSIEDLNSNSLIYKDLNDHEREYLLEQFKYINSFFEPESFEKLDFRCFHKNNEKIISCETDLDKKAALVCSSDCTCLYDLKNIKEGALILDHNADVKKGKLSDDGSLAVTVSSNGQIKIWNLDDLENDISYYSAKYEDYEVDNSCSISISKDNKLLLVGVTQLRLYNISDLANIKSMSLSGTNMFIGKNMFSTDSTHLMCLSDLRTWISLAGYNLSSDRSSKIYQLYPKDLTLKQLIFIDKLCLALSRDQAEVENLLNNKYYLEIYNSFTQFQREQIDKKISNNNSWYNWFTKLRF